jgi:hypothetical protein
MKSEKMKWLRILATAVVAAVIIQFGRNATEPQVWTRADLPRLAEELQRATHNCLEDNPEYFEAIANAEGGEYLSPLPSAAIAPGLEELLFELEKSVQAVLGPKVEARLASSLGAMDALEAVTGSYLAARTNKGSLKLAQQPGTLDSYVVEWSSSVILGRTMSLTFKVWFGEADQLRAIELLSVAQVDV